jgi:hypothetical protein
MSQSSTTRSGYGDDKREADTVDHSEDVAPIRASESTRVALSVVYAETVSRKRQAR